MFIHHIINNNNPQSIIDQIISIINQTQESDAISNYDVYKNVITKIVNDSFKVWAEISDKFYTDHSVGHSIRIVNHFLKLYKDYEINNYELAHFIIAAFIHDFGMQIEYLREEYFRNGNLKIFQEEFINEFNNEMIFSDENFRRDHHCEIGYCLINCHQKNFLNFLDIGQLEKDSYEYNIINHASLIGFSHCCKNIHKRLFEDNAYESRMISEGVYFRPRLLSGLLQLCDLLDCDYRRLVKPERIRAESVLDISRAHWLACLFVESVDIEKDFYDYVITFNWRFPHGKEKKVANIIKAFLEDWRLIEVDYNLKRILEEIKDPKVKTMQYRLILPDTGNERDDVPWEKYFEELIINEKKRINSYQRKKIKFCSEKFPIYDDFSACKKPGSLEDELKSWVKKNTINGHFELAGGDHTDVYFYCRTLVSDPIIIKKMAKEINDRLQEKKVKIDSVIGVGTSAIPLAVNLSLLFKCSSTFTFWSKKISQYLLLPNEQKKELVNGINNVGRVSNIDNYEFLEIKPTIKKENPNILIIDDIFSSGNLILKLLDSLDQYFGIRYNKVYCFSIFKLGKRKLPERENVYYDYLVPLPKVKYWKNKYCRKCKTGINPIREQDMF